MGFILILITIYISKQLELSSNVTFLLVIGVAFYSMLAKAKRNARRRGRYRNTGGGSQGVRIGTPCLISKNGSVVGDVNGVAHLDTGESYSCWTCSNRDYCSR